MCALKGHFINMPVQTACSLRNNKLEKRKKVLLKQERKVNKVFVFCEGAKLVILQITKTKMNENVNLRFLEHRH